MTLTLDQPVVIASRLEANLRSLAIRSPRVAEAVRRCRPHAGVRWVETDQPGAWSAELEGRALASKRRPVEEAERLADTVNFREAGVAVVTGCGLGFHVASIARRAGNHSLVLVFEPDVSLLRSVLEFADFSGWLGHGRVMFFTDPDDAAAITESLAGFEAMVGLGVSIVEHAASRPRLGDQGKRFIESFTRVVAACRMQVVTTMMQMQTTFRNLLMNVDHYARSGGVRAMRDAARGVPAIVVSAGPSLERNLHLLSSPGVRERCVIIAVQTVLKPMLARGIRPHFVTALDFHEISRRFYEGLTAGDVEGVTLVAEPKANPAILDSFPGRICVVGAEVLDMLLGPGLAGDHGSLPPGATVAHLAYSLARHLGCDPVGLIGQDLAFTDGQYYAAGAAIHGVWSPELNPFNTLEMMEWERIARWRGHLHVLKDHLGRDVYTDDQMSTYLAQFEREFLADRGRGLTTIDATEGGARKAHTIAMPLREMLDRFAPGDGPARVPDLSSGAGTAAHAARVQDRLRAVRNDCRTIAHLSRETASLLRRMPGVAHDASRLNPLIERVHALRDRVVGIEPAYSLVHRLNQAGAFKRFRADRSIGLDEGLAPEEVQRLRIERDLVNVEWLADAADELDDLLGAAIESLGGAPKRTRDLVAKDDASLSGSGVAAKSSARVAAVVPVDFEQTALGVSRGRLGLLDAAALLRRTVERLAACRRLDGIVLLSSDEAMVRRAIDGVDSGARVEIMRVERAELRAGRRSIAAARLWAPTCWRGGLGGLTCHDEVFLPSITAEALARLGFEAGLLVGPDWSAVDPVLCDAVIERHQESPATLPLTFSQAPPGLCGCVVGLELCRRLAQGRVAGDATATIGGLLGYRPLKPRRDPIAESCCVQIDPATRDRLDRAIADGAWERDACRVGECPRHMLVEIVGPSKGPRAGEEMEVEAFGGLCGELAARDANAVVTLGGRRDPLDHSRLGEILWAARAAGVAGVHVRTCLAGDEASVDALLAGDPDVISIDLHATTAETYVALSGRPSFERSLRTTERLLQGRRFDGGLPFPWVVPRITRRDAVYEQIEGFHDRALLFGGAGVIDPLPRAIAGERIAPLPRPRGVVVREAFSRMLVRCDGVTPLDETDPSCGEHTPAANALEVGVAGAWRVLVDRRRRALSEHGHTHPDLRTMP